MPTRRQLVTFIAVLFASSMYPVLGAARCPFTYTPKIRDRIIAPALKARLGKDFYKYDLRKPFITDFENSVGLTFLPRSGKRSGRVTIVFDSCRNRVEPRVPIL